MQPKNNKLINAVELISEQGFSGMAEAMQILLNEAMLVQRTRHLQAEPYERIENRQDYANGFKPKQLKTQLGELSLNVPQVRKGMSIALSEAEVHWRNFLESLQTRGLHGLKCIISDAHSGLRASLQAVLGSIPWQRCQFHLQQNAQSYVTKKAKKSAVAQSIKAIFNAENRHEAERLLELSATKYEQEMPKLAKWMREALPEGFTVFSLPQGHQRRMRTSNMAERVNQEIKRRTRVARIFPNIASCERLVTAVIMEISEQWQAGKNYLTMNDEN